MAQRIRSAVICQALMAAALAGCASGGSDPPGSLKLPELPQLPDMAAVASIVPPAAEAPAGSATELYTRIARGAVGCWFGSSGGLKQAYIYHAEADAPSRGGRAEIVVHERDLSQPNPRGAKAFKVRIEPKDETSAAVSSENLKMPEALGAAMTADVDRWARGEQGCAGSATTAQWAQGAPESPGNGAGAQASTKKAVKAKTAP